MSSAERPAKRPKHHGLVIPAPGCPICLDEVAVPPTMLVPCGHMYCGSCVLKVVDAAAGTPVRCAICKQVVTEYVVPPHLRQAVLDGAPDEWVARDLDYTIRNADSGQCNGRIVRDEMGFPMAPLGGGGGGGDGGGGDPLGMFSVAQQQREDRSRVFHNLPAVLAAIPWHHRQEWKVRPRRDGTLFYAYLLDGYMGANVERAFREEMSRRPGNAVRRDKNAGYWIRMEADVTHFYD